MGIVATQRAGQQGFRERNPVACRAELDPTQIFFLEVGHALRLRSCKFDEDWGRFHVERVFNLLGCPPDASEHVLSPFTASFKDRPFHEAAGLVFLENHSIGIGSDRTELYPGLTGFPERRSAGKQIVED